MLNNNVSKMSSRFDKMKIGSKLAGVTILIIGVLFGGYNLLLESQTKAIVKERSIKEIESKTASVISSMDIFDKAMNAQALRMADVFKQTFPANFSVDDKNKVEVAGKMVPALVYDNKPLNLDFGPVDQFLKNTGGVATIFVKEGEEFVRVTTSLKDPTGKRVIGTHLTSSHPGYKLLISGQEYTGITELFGKFYATNYRPIKDNGGNILGILFVGLDISKEMAAFKENIRTMKIGKSGYVYVLNENKNSKDYGLTVVHPVIEGKNLLDLVDANGDLFIQKMLSQKQGTIIYPWANKERNETTQDKIVVYQTFEKWHWLVASGTYINEITGDINQMYTIYTIVGCIVLLLLAVLVYFVINHLVSKPLYQLKAAAQQLASGDLRVKLTTTRQDEVGELYQAINNISQELAKLIHKVQQGAMEVYTEAQQIAVGNEELSNRTENQAAALEETASSMNEMTSTVQNNAIQAQDASALVDKTTKLVGQGNNSMSQVITTMSAIEKSSKKISDIISVIDTIAFQTNILALNAAVEAAHAGDQGRGFAVVAAEVRNLAQRCTNAAKEIKVLIGESSQEVTNGNAIVKNAGYAMNDILQSVNNLNIIMKGIASSNQEQSIGINQVNETVHQMDQATQQNAALVEEASAAAESLQNQAEELKDAVSKFII
jgi:methyl-accepting chemotaxis protein